MKSFSKKNAEEIISILRDLNRLFLKLNKETYHNLMISIKYLKSKGIFENNNSSNLRSYKTRIYSMFLVLEDIKKEIKDFLEELNEQI